MEKLCTKIVGVVQGVARVFFVLLLLLVFSLMLRILAVKKLYTKIVAGVLDISRVFFVLLLLLVVVVFL